jgi:hypothetical protein
VGGLTAAPVPPAQSLRYRQPQPPFHRAEPQPLCPAHKFGRPAPTAKRAVRRGSHSSTPRALVRLDLRHNPRVPGRYAFSRCPGRRRASPAVPGLPACPPSQPAVFPSPTRAQQILPQPIDLAYGGAQAEARPPLRRQGPFQQPETVVYCSQTWSVVRHRRRKRRHPGGYFVHTRDSAS